ncbi:type IV pilus modification protein PilV [Ramlibacter sp.]|uniref:type IV pilus modification protein PilV n=1 Tax=Ramlibacter sp. TaxID=1917967 RepID=UPI002D3BF932|nr:type IV pilus modification protein PilV [Ramlibacter sp.]HYD76851.1 type IV pilus modification protein PilV [Ramlibacter sp.]
MKRRAPLRRERGATLIEVLVTMVIIAFGLLGMAGLQVRMQVSELESYQRSQALMLLGDMANRLAANRNHASSYVTTTGTGATCPTSTSTTADIDIGEWCRALQGDNVKKGGASVGAMVGARGCVAQLSSSEYMVTVAWQGMAPISAPPASVTCGANQYDGAQCSGDKCRRVVTTLVRIATL